MRKAYVPISQQFNLFYFAMVACGKRGEGLHDILSFRRPRHDGGINKVLLCYIPYICAGIVLSFVEALCCHAIDRLSKWTFTETFFPNASFIYTFTVYLHPRLDAVENGLFLVIVCAIGTKGYRQQQISVL